MPGGVAAAGFLVEGLVVVHAHAGGAHELGGDAAEAFAHDEFLNGFVLGPNIGDLQEGFAVDISLLHGAVLLAELFDHVGNFGFVVSQNFGRKHVLELDVAVAAEAGDLLVGEGIVGVEVESLGGHCSIR